MTTIATGAPARVRGLSFYTWMGVACVSAAFLGFAPSYWAPLAAGKYQANPVVHIHGMLFFTWTLFFLLQTTLVNAGHVARHRAFGLAGISLATAMSILGVLVALNSLSKAVALGAAARGEAFVIVPLGDILVFAVLIAFAVANVHRPEIHKRLMLVATVSLLGAPIARPFLAYVFTGLPPGPPPVWATMPALLVADLFVLAAIAYDWRTRGRPHPVYLISGGAVLVLQLLRMPVSELPAWHHMAHGFLQLAGSTPLRPA